MIIVSYNVRYFLERCLASVFKALAHIPAEVIVVDNASADDSCEMIQSTYPEVRLIQPGENLGFGRANNLALKEASGEYILFLNPDTLVREDSFEKCISYMDAHPDTGACGVMMIDGSGEILPESKRGFPTPWVSVCKMLGLHKVFPKSALFNGYYLGHLNYETDHPEIEVLTGAFLFTRKNILDRIGGFDEAYFMYGEDIDLSTRIRRAGYKIAYLANTRIVHYKGESTRKATLSYHKAFYQAMMIFANQYFSGASQKSYIFLIRLGIIVKGTLSWLKQKFFQFAPIALDAGLILTGIFGLKKIWSKLYFQTDYHFLPWAFWSNAVLFTLVWLVANYFNGLYDKRPGFKDILISASGGLILNLIAYSLLPEEMRSSRMLLLLSFLYVLMYLILSRTAFIYLKKGSRQLKEVILIGNASECDLAEKILSYTSLPYRVIRRLEDDMPGFSSREFSKMVEVLRPDQLIVCSPHLPFHDIIQMMSGLPEGVEVKLMTAGGTGIIGSPSKNTPGEMYTMDPRFHIQKQAYKRQKRIFDFCFSLWLLLFFPLFAFINRKPWKFLRNIVSVLSGSRQWVGIPPEISKSMQISNGKPSILIPLPFDQKLNDTSFSSQYILHYAMYYSIWMDLDICLRNLQSLDQ